MTIGSRLSELRKKYSYSQEYVASVLGVTRQAVSKWETDQTSPDTNNLIALAQLFNVSVEYLATGKVNENEKTCEENIAISETRKIIGYILLGVGLLAVVQGLVFFTELLYFAAGLILAGILCIVVKKHFWITIICVFSVLIAISSRFIIRTSFFTIFNTVLLVLLIIVIVKVIKKVLQK